MLKLPVKSPWFLWQCVNPTAHTTPQVRPMPLKLTAPDHHPARRIANFSSESNATKTAASIQAVTNNLIAHSTSDKQAQDMPPISHTLQLADDSRFAKAG
jgi:hypothetical protein